MGSSGGHEGRTHQVMHGAHSIAHLMENREIESVDGSLVAELDRQTEAAGKMASSSVAHSGLLWRRPARLV